tara:strand:- start:147 stop:545 length:399 start_codon:yes stop_codon:yes gene_type:complete
MKLALDARVRIDSALNTSVQDSTLDAEDSSALITPNGTTVTVSPPERSLSAPRDATRKEWIRCAKCSSSPSVAEDALAQSSPAAEARSKSDKSTEALKERRSSTEEEILCSEFKYFPTLNLKDVLASYEARK